MHEAWGSESLSFSIVIIELSHSKEFWMAGTIQNSLEWLNPAGSTDCSQSENILVISFYLMYKIKWIS